MYLPAREFVRQDPRKNNDTARYHPLHCWDIASGKPEFLYTNNPEAMREWQTLKKLIQEMDWKFPIDVTPYLCLPKRAIIITNLVHEIIWVSHNIESLTGYTPSELLQRQPEVLQGEGTDLYTRQQIRQSLQEQKGISTHLVNYRKNRESYTCALNIQPLFNQREQVTHFIALKKEIL